MRASSQTKARQPLPLPLPPPPLSLPSPSATPRRRHPRRTASSSSSSSSSSSVSTASFCPSPSPAASPRASTSLVPFSWERHPGVPKNSLPGLDSPTGGAPLPLPPPLRPPPRRRRRRRANANANVPAGSSGLDTNSDPFVAAFAECTRDDDVDDADHGSDADVAVRENKLWLAPKPVAVSGRAERRWWLAGGGFVGFLDLYGCKSAMAVADGAFLARRPVAARPGPGRATRR
ncbi:hypothetical protein ACP70R_020511 [Stipagrostis hirtigluma subsp. patula]